MDISVNTNKVKDKKDEETSVTDNSKIEIIKATDILNYSSAVKNSSTTWTKHMKRCAWQTKRIF